MLLLYIHRLFNTYAKILAETLEWNKEFRKPIRFRYSWLQGVEIGEKGGSDSPEKLEARRDPPQNSSP